MIHTYGQIIFTSLSRIQRPGKKTRHKTYPAVEYDFVPNRLQLKVGDAIHLQWAGSNRNIFRFNNNLFSLTNKPEIMILQKTCH